MKALILGMVLLQPGLEEEERKVAEVLAGLERTMLRVMDVVEDPADLARLKRALAHLKTNMVRARAQNASEEIRRRNLEEALEEGRRIEKALRRVIDILEGRTRIEDVQPHTPKGEKLRAVERALREIREEQRKILKGTEAANGGVRTRAAIVRARELGERQRRLALKMGEIEKVLRGAAEAVFAFAVDQVEQEMDESRTALQRADTGRREQELQKHILRGLDRLLKAVELRRNELEDLNVPGPEIPPGKDYIPRRPRLLPPESELKLIRELQKDVLLRTARVSNRLGDDLTPIEKQLMRRLSDEQGRLSGLLRDLIQKYRRN